MLLKSEETYCFSSFWFLRLLGLLYLCAFVSLWVQLDGLIGSNGILPADHYLTAIREYFEGHALSEGFWKVPTLFWIGSGNLALHLGCLAGCLFSFLLMAGILPGATCFVLWFLYLSFVSVSGIFFGYQWDNLLLEVGFLAIFFSPLKFRPRLNDGRSFNLRILWLYRFLLFRLMFSSGFVKLREEVPGQNTWADLTALNYHYETQPLPTPLAWYVHQLPEWFDKASVASTLFIQLAIPFLLFGPGICRRIACVAFVFLQTLILLTGNYGFFNFLTLALCFLLLDDRFFRRFLRGWRSSLETRRQARPLVIRSRKVLNGSFFAVLLVLGLFTFYSTLAVPPSFLRPIAKLETLLSPFRSVNSYGLFASMTTTRPEIILQGSRDGRNWMNYEFKYKPGDLNRAPQWIAPHQPRLDWQMWFAALGDVRSPRNRWFLSFIRCLLLGEEEVENLLDTNPFSGEPPKFIRAVVYEYHFTQWGSGDSNWWRRDKPRVYCPPVSLDETGNLGVQEPNS